MVAVGSKSIPEKQSISLNLSKDSEDKLEDDLFSDIFSSQSLTSVEIKDSSSKINEHEPKIDYNLQTNELAKDINDYNEIFSNFDIDQELTNISKDTFKSEVNLDKKTIVSEEILSNNTLDETDYETGVPAELKNNLEDNNIDQNLGIIQLGILSSKLNSHKNEEETNNSNNVSLSEDENPDKNFRPQLNSIVSKLKPDDEKLNNKKIRVSSNVNEQIEDLDEFKDGLNNKIPKNITENLHRNKSKLETSISKTMPPESNLNQDEDDLNEIKVNKVDFSKIKKEEIILKDDILVDKKNLKISDLKTNTEKFFQTKYINSSNTYLPQVKNNLTNNQNSSSNLSLDLSNMNPLNNLNSGNSNTQNGTQSQSNINHFQTLNDIKENLDMSDKRWASNLVSRLNKAHSSKINELELVLTPKNLGRMKIKISLSDKTAFVKISTDNSAASALIQEEQQKLNEMFKEVGLELEDFSSEQSFQQNSHDDKSQNKDKTYKIKSDEINNIKREDNYIKDESILNIKV